MDECLRLTLMRFLASETVERGEVVEIGGTGLVALRDADGVLRFAPARALEIAGAHLPLYFALAAREGRGGSLDYLDHLIAKDLATATRKAAGAARSSRSSIASVVRTMADEEAPQIWQRRSALTLSTVADLVLDHLRTAAIDAPSKRSVEHWMNKFRPERR